MLESVPCAGFFSSTVVTLCRAHVLCGPHETTSDEPVSCLDNTAAGSHCAHDMRPLVPCLYASVQRSFSRQSFSGAQKTVVFRRQNLWLAVRVLAVQCAHHRRCNMVVVGTSEKRCTLCRPSALSLTIIHTSLSWSCFPISILVHGPPTCTQMHVVSAGFRALQHRSEISCASTPTLLLQPCSQNESWQTELQGSNDISDCFCEATELLR